MALDGLALYSFVPPASEVLAEIKTTILYCAFTPSNFVGIFHRIISTKYWCFLHSTIFRWLTFSNDLNIYHHMLVVLCTG